MLSAFVKTVKIAENDSLIAIRSPFDLIIQETPHPLQTTLAFLFFMVENPLLNLFDMQTVYFPTLQRGTSVTPHIVNLPEVDFVQRITPLPIRKKDQYNRNTLLSLIVVDTPPGVYPPPLYELARGTPGDSLNACIN
jgi:hypothetical protein